MSCLDGLTQGYGVAALWLAHSIDDRALRGRLWNTGERLALEAGDTGLVCIGDACRALSYSSCNP